jgi:putative isomerase
MKTLIACIFFTLFSLGLVNAQKLQLNLEETPFSHYGSYMAFSVYSSGNDTRILYLRDVSGNLLWQNNKIFSFELDSGTTYQYSADASLIKVASSSSNFAVTFQDANTIRIKGHGKSLRINQILSDISSLYFPVGENRWRLQMGGNAHYVLTVLQGKGSVDGTRAQVHEAKNYREPAKSKILITPDNLGNYEIAIEQYFIGWSPSPFNKGFEDCVSESQYNFEKWLGNSPSAPSYLADARLLAAYINWSCVVSPRGNVKRTIMYSSKNNMHAIWAWDHCFYALSAAYHLPDFAWDNFIHLFDHQDSTGGIPDIITDRVMVWGFVKPPIHGWTLREMIKANPKMLTPERSRIAYQALSKWTNFWFTYMDDDHDGIPQYNHGNDSGWDNATSFDMGFPAESPDLCAYLIIQMDVLADLAKNLHFPAEATKWKQKSDRLLKDMISQFWTGEKFVTKRSDDNKINEKSHSLMSYLPLVLGNRLPVEITKKMIADLKGNNSPLTAIGLASENINSALYSDDSYWRGPVWAPPTLVICSGLRECGEYDFAKEIAKRFCVNCQKNGFGENFDAKTGKSLRDRSLPWSSAIFLILTQEFLTAK